MCFSQLVKGNRMGFFFHPPSISEGKQTIRFHLWSSLFPEKPRYSWRASAEHEFKNSFCTVTKFRDVTSGATQMGSLGTLKSNSKLWIPLSFKPRHSRQPAGGSSYLTVRQLHAHTLLSVVKWCCNFSKRVAKTWENVNWLKANGYFIRIIPAIWFIWNIESGNSSLKAPCVKFTGIYLRKMEQKIYIYVF